MIAGFVNPVRRTVAARPLPAPSHRAKAMAALRDATGPGFAHGGLTERVLQQATRR